MEELPIDVLGLVFALLGPDKAGDASRANARMCCRRLSAVPLTRVRVLTHEWRVLTVEDVSRALRGARGCRDLSIDRPDVLLAVATDEPNLVANVATLRSGASETMWMGGALEAMWLSGALRSMSGALLPSLREVVVEGRLDTLALPSAEDAAAVRDPRVTVRYALLNVKEDTTLEGMDRADVFWDALGGRRVGTLDVRVAGVPSDAVFARLVALLRRVDLCADSLRLYSVIGGACRVRMDAMADALRRVRGASAAYVEGSEALAGGLPASVSRVHVMRRANWLTCDGSIFCALERSWEALRHLRVDGTVCCDDPANHDALRRLLRRVERLDVGDGDRWDYLPAISADAFFPLLSSADALDTLTLANVSPAVVVHLFADGKCHAPRLRRVALLVSLEGFYGVDRRAALAALAEGLSHVALKELEVYLWCGWLSGEEAEFRRSFDLNPTSLTLTLGEEGGKAPRFGMLPFQAVTIKPT